MINCLYSSAKCRYWLQGRDNFISCLPWDKSSNEDRSMHTRQGSGVRKSMALRALMPVSEGGHKLITLNFLKCIHGLLLHMFAHICYTEMFWLLCQGTRSWSKLVDLINCEYHPHQTFRFGKKFSFWNHQPTVGKKHNTSMINYGKRHIFLTKLYHFHWVRAISRLWSMLASVFKKLQK